MCLIMWGRKYHTQKRKKKELITITISQFICFGCDIFDPMNFIHYPFTFYVSCSVLHLTQMTLASR